MKRAALLAAIATCWLPALAWPGTKVSLAGGTVAVLLAPGFLLDRLASAPFSGETGWFERVARSLTLSVGLIAVLGPVCTVVGLSVVAVLAMIAVVSALLAAAPVPNRRPPQLPACSRFDRAAMAALIAAAVVVAYMAITDHNIARDRMWYLAYVTRLSQIDRIDWQEPFFGTGRVVSRFAYNGWLVALSAWTRLTGARSAFLFEQAAPPLLSVCVASAAFALGRSLFGSRARASTVGLATLLVLLCTRYPFFSPDRYPFFGRLPEDKSVALLVFMPVALSFCFDALLAASVRKRLWTAVAVALGAVASSHALVYLLALLVLVPFAAWSAWIARLASPRRALTVLILSGLVAAGPTALGFRARSQILDAPDVVEALSTEATHPVVRSHLRMDRLLALPRGGPIVRPELLGDPLLLVALCALPAAWVRRRQPWGAYALIAGASALSLAFVPFVAPIFGRLVLPWMAYRALWAIPFGVLVAALVLELPELLQLPGGAVTGPRALAAVLVLATAIPYLPVRRLAPNVSSSDDERRLLPDARTLELLDQIASLPNSARIAAAPGLAELIPAYAGRAILAFSDRGTTVFAGSRRDAERRMEANAALIGLRGGSSRLRNRAAGRYDVTHVVYEHRPCDRKAAQIFTNETYTLCAERLHARGHRLMARFSAAAPADPGGALVASLLEEGVCRPPGERIDAAAPYRWRRDRRWSGLPVVVECSIRFPEPTLVGRLRVGAHLPRSDESIVYRIVARTPSGKRLRRSGALEFRGNPYGELRLPALHATQVKVRLTPAYLPYLNLTSLEIRR